MRHAAIVIAAAALAGCADERRDSPDQPPPRERPAKKQPRIKPLRCPASAGNCRSATGRVIFIEARDPDGDGDLHVVLASSQGITAPGVTVVDVARRLRPRRDPRAGDLVAAAGPVYRGSYGQRQIEADAVRFRRGR